MIQGHTRTHEYPDLPELDAFREQFGYDPLRWLWTRSIDGRATGEGNSPELATAFSIIAGISDRWELAAWSWAERVTRDRVHIHHHLRRRDVAIVEGTRRFARADEYPWTGEEAVEAAATAGDVSA